MLLIDSPPQIDTDAKLAIRERRPGADSSAAQPARCLGGRGRAGARVAERRNARVVLNRVPPTSRLGDTVKADLAMRNLPLLRAAIGNRTGFAIAFAAGLGVTEAAPRSSAAAELRALLDELREISE